jgi:uncharacterized protein (TIGR03067 family)
MVSGYEDGTAVPDPSREISRKIFKEDEATIKEGTPIVMKAKMKLDPSKRPKGIDYLVVEGRGKGQTRLGIYELGGDTVKLCLAAPGDERPTDFLSKLGDGRTIGVWKRSQSPLPTEPIGPGEAAKRIGQEVRLRMKVKSAAMRGQMCFLNSEQNFRDEANFTVFVGPEALAKFKELKIEDPAAHFEGKTVLVVGKVSLFRDRPQLSLDAPEKISVIDAAP